MLLQAAVAAVVLGFAYGMPVYKINDTPYSRFLSASATGMGYALTAGVVVSTPLYLIVMALRQWRLKRNHVIATVVAFSLALVVAPIYLALDGIVGAPLAVLLALGPSRWFYPIVEEEND